MASANTVIDPAHLAKLSSLTLSSAQIQKLAQQFTDTLNVVANLNQLDTLKIEPTFQVTGQVNRFREDIIDPSSVLTQKEALSNAAKTHHGYFVVPGVLS